MDLTCCNDCSYKITLFHSIISTTVAHLYSVHTFIIYLRTESAITCYIVMVEWTYMDIWRDLLVIVIIIFYQDCSRF